MSLFPAVNDTRVVPPAEFAGGGKGRVAVRVSEGVALNWTVEQYHAWTDRKGNLCEGWRCVGYYGGREDWARATAERYRGKPKGAVS